MEFDKKIEQARKMLTGREFSPILQIECARKRGLICLLVVLSSQRTLRLITGKLCSTAQEVSFTKKIIGREVIQAISGKIFGNSGNCVEELGNYLIFGIQQYKGEKSWKKQKVKSYL